MLGKIESLLQKFLPSTPGGAHPNDPELRKKIQIATCIFFILMAKADDDFSDVEEDKIVFLMKDIFQLEKETINDIMEYSEQLLDVNSELSIYTDFINKHYHFDEKYELLKNLWILIFADETTHENEEKLVHKIAKAIKVDRFLLEEAKEEAKSCLR